MRIQILVVTTNQSKGDYSLLEKMNIQSDVIICNQSDYNEVVEFMWNGHNVKWYSFAERGVGLNRNNALMRADADICLFADDDVVYYDGYIDEIKKFYIEHPDAEMVLFNFKVKRGDGDFEDIIKQTKTVRGRLTAYGTICITVKTVSIRRNNIYFHLEFGGGTNYSSGEDSIFLNECVKKRLKIYKCQMTLGTVDNKISSWFEGYTDKYFYDKGVLFYELVGFLAPLASIYHVVKHRKIYNEYGVANAIKKINEGIVYRKTEYKSKKRGKYNVQ